MKKIENVKELPVGTNIPFGANDSELEEDTIFIPKGFHAIIDGDKIVIKKGDKPDCKELIDELKSIVDVRMLSSLGVPIITIAKHIARWQKKKDDHAIEIAHMAGEEEGKNLLKQQMLQNAITATCFGFQGAALFSFRLPSDNYLVGSERKIVLIKDE